MRSIFPRYDVTPPMQEFRVVPYSDTYELVNSPEGYSIRAFETYRAACIRQVHPLHIIHNEEERAQTSNYHQYQLLHQTLSIILDALYSNAEARKSANAILLNLSFEVNGLLTRKFLDNMEGSLRQKQVNGIDIILDNITKTAAAAYNYLSR